MSTAPGSSATPRAAIHDLGYRRYVGTRRPQSTRWQVIVKNQVAVTWRGFWRMKAWVIGALMTTGVFGILMYVGRQKIFEELAGRATGSKLTFVDAMLPWSFFVYPWFAFVMTVAVGSSVISRDLKAGAFEFYFSRPVRPLDYVLGKVAGLTIVMAAVTAAGPLALALFRVGLAEPADMLATLIVIPKALAVGLLGALAMATMPLAVSALSAKARNAIAMWTAIYLVAGNMIQGIADASGHPDLAVLHPPRAILAFAFELFDVTFAIGNNKVGSGWLGAAALLGYSALSITVILVRVRQAERAGLGGG